MNESSAVQVQNPESHLAERAPLEAPRSMGEAYREFKDRVIVEDKTAPRQQQKETDLTKATPKELKEWEQTGEVSEPKQGKESAEGKSDAKPLTEGDGKQLSETEAQQQPNRYDRLLERASKEPDFEKVVERLHEPFFPLSQEGHARYQVMGYALQQCSNSEDVLYFLARPENASVAFAMQQASPHKIAQTIHMVSAELRFGKGTTKAAGETRPRAPRPPSEVGGHGAPPRDAEADAVRRNDFRSAEAIWNKRLKQRER